MIVFMIRNRLAELLKQRNLKITKVAQDIGISRNTLTTISQNGTRSIQIDILNILCGYLGIAPNEFFIYVPFDINVSLQSDFMDLVPTVTKDQFDIGYLFHEFLMFFEVRRRTFSQSLELGGRVVFNAQTWTIDFSVEFISEEDEKEYEKLRESMPLELLVQFTDELKIQISDFFGYQISNYIRKKPIKGKPAALKSFIDFTNDISNHRFSSKSSLFNTN